MRTTVLEPVGADGRILSQEECCWNRASDHVPHLLGQICAAYNVPAFYSCLASERIEADHAVLIFSWPFGEELAPLVDRLLENCARVTLVANPPTTAAPLQSEFQRCQVVPSSRFTSDLADVDLPIRRPSFIVQFASGCPWRCSYCVWDARYRLYDPAQVAATIAKRLQYADSRRPFYLLGNELSGKFEWLSSLAAAMPAGVTFGSDLNVRNTTAADILTARGAGLRKACIGIEFLTDRMLQRLNKGHTVDDALRVMGWLTDAGIGCVFSLRSSVGETPDDLRELSGNLDRMHALGLKPARLICGSPMLAWPGTKWANRAHHQPTVNIGSNRFPIAVRLLPDAVKPEWKTIINQCRTYGWLSR